jgi:trypsin
MKVHIQIFALGLALLSGFGPDGKAAAEEEEIILGGKRIVGGEPTTIDKHPWQVAIVIKRPEGSYLCGGSIIARKWVLSAAHCFHASDRNDTVRAKAGATNFVRQGVWSQIEKMVIHDQYNPATHENDLALIKLRVAPAGRVIPLVDASQAIPLSEPLEVTGWGATAEGEGAARGLMQASVPYVDNATCNEPLSYDGRVQPGMMCAGRREGGVDSCQGDSGGPLVWRTDAGPVIVGVVSFGEGCGRQLKYGVYTRVSAYRDWINGVVAADRN